MMQRLSLLCLAACALSGCALSGGPRAGAVIDHADPSDTRYTHAASVSAATAWMTQGPGLHAGLELEGLAEWERGGMWTTGLQVGPSYTPEPGLFAPGFVSHADVGFALQEGLYDAYVGASFMLPISLEPRLITDRNRGFSFVARRVELAPELRYRAYWLAGDDWLWRHSITAALSLRLRLESDIVADLF